MATTNSHGLNHKQLMFANYILEGKTQRESYRLAGYTVKDDKTADEAASRLSRNVKIKAYIESKQAVIEEKVAEKIAWDKAKVIESFAEIADRCMQKEPVMYFDKVDKCMKQEKAFVRHEDGQTTEEGVWEFDAGNACRAVENIGKIVGAYEVDNKQKSLQLPEFLAGVQARIGIINVTDANS